MSKLLPTSNTAAAADEDEVEEGDEDEDEEEEEDGARALLTPASLPIMATTLLAATAGFPKIHRVWDFILGGIFPLDTDRALPTTRYVKSVVVITRVRLRTTAEPRCVGDCF